MKKAKYGIKQAVNGKILLFLYAIIEAKYIIFRGR